ncbi:uncharacterized protein LOC127712863 [Mytilus californianus]|uniref:uncharacterized protein LOC127712863 n=1 Tax=Mytilus californianus TaxID=6549 RepID=UPI002245BE4D|nr:uncharacterized protein LOC127712863 [Mytilus californianus]
MEIVWKQHEHGTDQLTDLLDKDDYQGATFEIKKEERYNFVSSKHPEEKVNVTVGDPCFENPCSYESVEKVFDHIRDLTGLTDNSKVRQWTMLGCDGLPYTLGSRTIENVSVCQDCKMEFDEEANFKDHIKQNDHCKELSANDCRKYNNIVMIPGLGHYEINMVKVLIKLLWDIAVFDLAKMLGFHSPKALQSFQNAGDHHKSWQSLMIFMHSMAQELLVPYCRQEVKKNANPSLTGYFSYLNGATSSNYKFMSEVVFTYCLALHVFRAGIRRDNSTAIQAGKVKFSPLFFGFNMPFYMETFIRDSFVRVQCPPEVLAFIGANESYSASGHDSKREGGDFVLENINRKSKMWMPSGLPDKKKWLEVYCNIDRLDEVQDHMYNIQHLQPADDECVHANRKLDKDQLILLQSLEEDISYICGMDFFPDDHPLQKINQVHLAGGKAKY